MDSKVSPCPRSWFSWLCSLLQSPLLLVIRLVWGFLFLQAGISKFASMSETIEFFQGLDIPYAVWAAYAVAFFETVGGALLIVGLWTRLAALPLVVIMVVAYLTAHNEALMGAIQNVDLKAFMNESPFTFLLASLVLVAFGPGVFSLDWVTNLFGRKKKKPVEESKP
ncbi:MAG: DoxX family protein [Chlamydiia bacterium]|nr:DoxX family protein [Chlamydiia bacterium]